MNMTWGLMRLRTQKMKITIGILFAIILTFSTVLFQPGVKAGSDFFAISRLPVTYSYWGVLEDFHARLSEVDDNEYLDHSSKSVPLEEADLIIIVLDDWDDLGEIPIKYAGLIPVIQKIDPQDKSSTYKFDFSITENGEKRPVRAHFIALTHVSPKNSNPKCLFEYVYATALYQDINSRLESVNCGKKG
jgi:hypothetical protein